MLFSTDKMNNNLLSWQIVIATCFRAHNGQDTNATTVAKKWLCSTR